MDMCTPEELSRPTSTGERPAHWAAEALHLSLKLACQVMYGTSWCLQKLVELGPSLLIIFLVARGADTVSVNNAGDTPEAKIWRLCRIATA